MNATVMLVAGCLMGGFAQPSPAEPAEPPPPPPMPAPPVTPQDLPVESPTPMAPQAPPPGPVGPREEGLRGRAYEARPLSGVGMALTAGAGVAGFFNAGARDAVRDGFTWDVRFTLGTRT